MYDRAWALGLNLCQCDVTLSCDGVLVLNSADNMGESTDPMLKLSGENSPRVEDNQRPTLLRDVLEMAHAVGEHARLVIELKPSRLLIGRALVSFLAAHIELLPHVAVVMSFDLYSLHEFARGFAKQVVLDNPNSCGRPQLMLLTVNKPLATCEISLSLHDEDSINQVCGLLHADGSALDGVYVEWHPAMLTCTANLSGLARRFSVGVWRYAGQADTMENAKALVRLGVQFVSTDLPSTFVPGLEPKSSFPSTGSRIISLSVLSCFARQYSDEQGSSASHMEKHLEIADGDAATTN
eukprot:891738-Amphidinium_carterae.1